MYTGTEVHARRATALGGAGTICGLANVVPEAMRSFLDAESEQEAERWHALIAAVDDALCVRPFLPACKAAIALARSTSDWLRMMPPLTGLDERGQGELARAFASIAERHRLPIA